MVGNDIMGPALQLIEAQFSYFFLERKAITRVQTSRNVDHEIEWPYFGSA